MLMSNKRSLESRSREGPEGKSYKCQPHFCCPTLFSSEGSATLHALKSGHMSPGLSDATQRVVIRMPNGMHGHAHAYRSIQVKRHALKIVS